MTKTKNQSTNEKKLQILILPILFVIPTLLMFIQSNENSNVFLIVAGIWNGALALTMVYRKYREKNNIPDVDVGFGGP